MINGCLASGYVPSSLQTGKMTLIIKKEPSLEVKNKQPLTVSSVLLSVFTKLLHKRMNAVCVCEGFYGEVQYGFRKNRSLLLLGQLKGRTGPSQSPSVILQRLMIHFAANFYIPSFLT